MTVTTELKIQSKRGLSRALWRSDAIGRHDVEPMEHLNKLLANQGISKTLLLRTRHKNNGAKNG